MAVICGLLGLLRLFAASRPPLQTIAFIAGFVSVVSFLWLAWSAGAYNTHVARVVMADLVALACLIVGVVAHVYIHHRG